MFNLSCTFIPDCPLASSFPRRRESSNKTRCEADRGRVARSAGTQQRTPCGCKTAMPSRFAGSFSINWIPACAGMTGFSSNGQSRFVFVVLAGLIATSNALAADQAKPDTPIKPQDFAYAVPLQFKGQDALYQATLPLSVYQNTVRNDLGDLRVFNAQGEVVPHMLQQAERSSISQPELVKLVYFQLQGPVNSGLDQLSVRIKRNTSGTLIDIGSNAKPSGLSKLSGYLIDASSSKQTIQALELDWAAGRDSFVGTLHLESSDDLKHWRTVVSSAPLASLQFGGHSLLQKRVEFPALLAKYMRLSWPQAQAPLALTGISAELAGARIDAPLTWHTILGSAVAERTGEYQFDVGAHLPAQRVRIALPQMNTLVQAALFSRARTDDTWHPATNTVLYKLHHSGQDLNNPEIAVTGSHRYWLLRVEQKNGGLGSGMPEMQLGWQPHQLQFVTRGSAPFQLAYGSREVKPAEFQIQNIFSVAEPHKSPLKIQPAQTGVQIELGGEARMKPAPLSHPWKKWILWTVLGGSVLLLGWMAYRLVQQMEKHDSSKPV